MIVSLHIIVVDVVGEELLVGTAQVRYARHVLGGRVMCEWCNDIEGFGHYGVGGTRPRVREARDAGCCNYYIQACRDYYIESYGRYCRNELRRIPKRDPDDPKYTVDLGEGLIPFMISDMRDRKDWYFLMYLPTRRRRLYRLKAAGEGAERSRRESATRGVEDETNGWTKLHDY